MHFCIAAYYSGVPVLPLAYSRKFKVHFADKLGYHHLSELDKDDADTTLSKLTSLLDLLENIKSEFPERLVIIQRYKNELVEHMASKVGKLIVSE